MIPSICVGNDGYFETADVDEEDLITYIIEGIKDSATNKIVLYDALDVLQLKTGLNCMSVST